MRRFSPNANGYEHGEFTQRGHYGVFRHPTGRFMVMEWNRYHTNWMRFNREDGGAVNYDPDVLLTDNLGGGPVLMTLTAAREEAGIIDDGRIVLDLHTGEPIN